MRYNGCAFSRPTLRCTSEVTPAAMRSIVLDREPSMAFHVVPGRHLDLDIRPIRGGASITVIGLFIHDRDPPNIVLCANNLEVGMAIKNAGKHQMTDETRRGRDPLRAKEIARPLRGQALKSEPARFDSLSRPSEMNVNDHLVILRGIPDRLVDRIIVTTILDGVRNLHCFEAEPSVFLDVLCGFFRVENRNQGNADEALWVVAEKFVEPSVVRAKNGALKRAVSETVEKSPDTGK